PIDPPGRTMRPVDANAVADLAAEQLVARHAKMPGLGVEQGVLDRAERQRDHAAGGRSRRAVELRIDPLMLAGVMADHARRQPLDRSRNAGRAKPLVEFAPADDAA